MFLVIVPFYQLIVKEYYTTSLLGEKTFLFQNDYTYIKYEEFLTIILSLYLVNHL